ncbi:hypothetical protein BH23ACT12_BH23ACT12_09200 [soil metagenome]
MLESKPASVRLLDDYGAGNSSGCPPRPRSEAPEDIGFVRRPMVQWLNPRQLLKTASRLGLSYIFGAYADKRELQVAMNQGILDRSDHNDLWVDYVADLGDGFDSTYAVARMLAAKRLRVAGQRDNVHSLRRGKLLIMGGDQVYPGSSRADYVNRMIGPYRAALPCSPQEQRPELFAIPGSHDWHDGLTNFMRIFCQQRWIGGWKTQQQRSYFAIKLPHGWWLWGVDIQFDSYIDDLQLSYFSEAASIANPGDRIILCTAKAPWLRTAKDHSGAYSVRNLDYFERRVLQGSGARVELYISSGRHHYCRYEPEAGDDPHRLTSGGGGAFTHPTHVLPERLDMLVDGRQCRYRQASTFPSSEDSRRLRKRLWLLPAKNLSLVGLLGAMLVVLAVMLGLHVDGQWASLRLEILATSLSRNPPALMTVGAMLGVQFGGLVVFAHEARGLRRWVLGLTHSAAQLGVMAGSIVAASRAAALVSGPVAGTTAFFALLWLIGGVATVLCLAAYLWATNLVGMHANEAYGALGTSDFKHFLRLHFDAAGGLTLYPIGIDRAPKGWLLNPKGRLDAPWFDPTEPEDLPHL